MVPRSISCPSCSATIPVDSRFCSLCGQSVVSSSQATTTDQPHDPVPATARHLSSDSIPVGGFTPGAILADRYRIIGLLGRGGMGEVYRADDLKLGQPVALKFLPRHLATEKDRLERFYAEVRIARQVSHPNVCRVYDVGEIDGQQYLSMEYVDGEDLASLLKRIGRLPPDKALEISRELCGGLAAAHDRGVLHRDLKPSNVMIDGRGRARITDFGLAVAADAQADGDISGTPAYMAPEQLAGKSASVRSDIYALGLVLYELSTGKKAFDGATLDELRRKHTHDAPVSPSKHAAGFDPAVEKVILRCLEKDPVARPASASQVAVALPGGDPLAAAIAAGETPSPEMVAAAGAEGALSPANAWTMLGATVVVLAGLVGLARFSMDQGLAPLPKSPEVLDERARQLIQSFGYTTEPADSASWWQRNEDYLGYLAEHEPSPEWRRNLSRTDPHPWIFWHRQSPRFLVPLDPLADPVIGPGDPPLVVSGMVNVALDARGKLLFLRAVPPQVEAPGAPAAPAPDWKPLFDAAGLDFARFKPSSPRWLPAVPFDARGDWDGAYASRPNMPVHVAAAAYAGKPVSFEIIAPWSVPERMQERPQTASGVAVNAAFIVFIGGGWTAAIVLARRNLRLGRGDRRGAFRAALVVFAAGILRWLFGTHFVADVGTEVDRITYVVPMSLFFGTFVWLAYLAIEPIARRRWPQLLFSLSRVVSGRIRDPLVGRDVLAGILAGASIALVFSAANALPLWIRIPDVTPLFPSGESLSGLGPWAARVFQVLYIAALNSLGLMTLLVLAEALLRRRWLAMALTGLLCVGLLLGGENVAVELPVAVTVAAVLIFVAVRFGVLALFVLLSCELLVKAPFTLDLSRWYAARGLVLVGLFFALAVWAFRVALGGRPVFGAMRLDEAPRR